MVTAVKLSLSRTNDIQFIIIYIKIQGTKNGIPTIYPRVNIVFRHISHLE